MKTRFLIAAILLCGAPVVAAADNVVTYHNSNQRDGAYIIPSLTTAIAPNIRRDFKFGHKVSISSDCSLQTRRILAQNAGRDFDAENAAAHHFDDFTASAHAFHEFTDLGFRSREFDDVDRRIG